MDDERTTPIDHRRLTALGLCLTFGLAVLVAQLVRFQIFGHPEIEDWAQSQRELVRIVAPPRGQIADRNGSILAMNTFQWEISASPNLVSEPGKLADQLASLMNQDRNEIYAKLADDKVWVLLDRFAPQEVGEAVDSLNHPGLICTCRPLRTYPMDTLAAHVLGFVNQSGDGFYGIEGFYDRWLRGITGTIQIEHDPIGAILPRPPNVLRPPKPGTDLVLTLDVNMQHIVQQELEKALERYDAESGTVIVMDPKTGAILAMASIPTYSPNDFAEADLELLADPSVSKMWEPGSVFKIVTWGAGLDAGIITPKMRVYDQGEMEVGGRTIANSDRKAHGEVTMMEALAKSLNTIAAYVSTTLGKDRYYTYLRRFGFGDLTGVDLASEGPGILKLPGDSNWYPSDLGTNSFGQGIAVTPMQMIAAASAVANDGLLMKPHIVQQFITEDEDNETVEVTQFEPEIVRQAISKEAAATLTDMLVEVVETTATEAQVTGYRIAGKTGTAQIPTPLGYHAKDTIVSFVGYAPADDPQFIVLVKLDRPKTSRWADRTAAPAFREIAERVLVYMQIPPDDIRLAQQ